MKYKDLRPGMAVMIVPGHESEYGGRRGTILEVGTFTLVSKEIRKGAVVDIGEPGLLIVAPSGLMKIQAAPLETGWEEFDI